MFAACIKFAFAYSICFAALLLGVSCVNVSCVNDVIEREQRDDYYVEVVVLLAWLTDALNKWYTHIFC